MFNLAEYIAGTNPNDPVSKLKITSIIIENDGKLKIEFLTVPGKQYSIEYTTNLQNDIWTVITNLTSTTSKTIINDSLPINQRQKFFRIGVQK
ncbi:MAG: hypothetical protein QXI16_07270, partial [Sulfolobaceae archaeon]